MKIGHPSHCSLRCSLGALADQSLDDSFALPHLDLAFPLCSSEPCIKTLRMNENPTSPPRGVMRLP